MKIYVDARFLEERAAFDLRACCEDCVHFHAEADVCSYTYPTLPHRAATHAALREGDGVLFCKTFEAE